MNAFLSNTVFKLRLKTAGDDEETLGLAQRLCVFLSPYLQAAADGSDADLSVELFPASAFLPAWRRICVEPALIRETYAVGFTLRVERGVLGDGSLLAWDDQTRVGYRIERESRRVSFYCGESAFIHLIELVRYFGLLVEQARGTAILHSAAVIDKRTQGAIAIAGMKGAGKTTTMLDMVTSGKFDYFSGDKLLLDIVDGRLRARGWPDFPHIGLGTLRQYPDLVRALGPLAAAARDPALADTQKILIAPEVFAQRLGRSARGISWLQEVVLPEVAAEEAVQLRRLPRAEIEPYLVDLDIFEWPHTFITSTWHGMAPAGQVTQRQIAPAIREALCSLTWTHVRGRSAGRAPALA